jgi:signal transduction histidine kinase
VTLACACDAELVMCGDEELLERLFLNLIDNAVKFTPAGGTVTIAAALNGAGGYVINVADTGSGIAADDQPKIFERFFRADRGRGGAGLGLPIARWIAEAHGGRVMLERSGASGSTFAVVLPAVVAPDASC